MSEIGGRQQAELAELAGWASTASEAMTQDAASAPAERSEGV
jgi:hypothetical protein